MCEVAKIRTITKPSTAKCNLNTYTLFLLAESKYGGCVRLAQILEGLSHDCVNRFLLREHYEPKDLFEELKPHINVRGGVLSGDDTVIDKPYRNPFLTKIIGYFWSGKHHRVVKGIQLITLYYTDPSGKSVPVNYRLYDKEEGKTKNDYLREMISEVLVWGLQPKTVTTDAWYASRKNLKFIREKGLGLLMGIAKNRLCSLDGRNYTQVQNLKIPREGLIVHLKNFGQVKVFQQVFKNEDKRYYIISLPEPDALIAITRIDFHEQHSIHWGIECYHRAIKQVCGIERFMLRTTSGIKNHFFCAIRAFSQLELMRAEALIGNWYELHRNLSIQVVRDFILEHLPQPLVLSTHCSVSVNA